MEKFGFSWYNAVAMVGANHVLNGGNPLECDIPAEIPLVRPPLELALAQIRFPSILPIEQRDSPMVAEFQESVRSEYPDYGIETGIALALGPGGAVQQQAAPSRHIFKSGDGWEISLTRDFVVLSTTSYKAKDEFAEKVHSMAEAVRAHIRPHRADRLGVRFIDRVKGDDLLNIGKYVAPQFLGAYSMFGDTVQSMVTESLLTSAEGESMIARWGRFSAEQTPDGVGIQPLNEPSWVLDSDIYTGKFAGFDPHEIAEKTKALNGRAYAFFRRVFNEEFIRNCGGAL